MIPKCYHINLQLGSQKKISIKPLISTESAAACLKGSTQGRGGAGLTDILRLKPTWATQQVPGHPGLHSFRLKKQKNRASPCQAEMLFCLNMWYNPKPPSLVLLFKIINFGLGLRQTFPTTGPNHRSNCTTYLGKIASQH